ncbi:MAG: hypothetical protein KF774_00920 [Planctomyces sp.]|nr:hypothetical protein [Planctomyces sp.]
MRALIALWKDEAGLVLSAEAVAIGTLGVAGATVGLSAASTSLNSELEEVAFAIRSLDQSFAFEGRSCCGAMTAGSTFTQMSVEEAHAELRRRTERDRSRAERDVEDPARTDAEYREWLEQFRREDGRDRARDAAPEMEQRPGRRRQPDRESQRGD